MGRIEEHREEHETIRLERRDGILRLSFHTDASLPLILTQQLRPLVEGNLELGMGLALEGLGKDDESWSETGPWWDDPEVDQESA